MGSPPSWHQHWWGPEPKQYCLQLTILTTYFYISSCETLNETFTATHGLHMSFFPEYPKWVRPKSEIYTTNWDNKHPHPFHLPIPRVLSHVMTFFLSSVGEGQLLEVNRVWLKTQHVCPGYSTMVILSLHTLSLGNNDNKFDTYSVPKCKWICFMFFLGPDNLSRAGPVSRAGLKLPGSRHVC